MLPPDARMLLTDALRPPSGAEFERAVALTFSLDLESALVVPLAFAAHAAREATDPLTVLQAVRRCADRVDILCQAGQITVPARDNALYAFLEKMVHPVRRPRQGRLFHPKLWALRFRDEASGVRLARLLVLTRNLTSDRSWDACIRLDGEVTNSPRAANKPLADLIRHAVDLAIDLPAERRTQIEAQAEDFRRVEWELPEGVTGLAFHALGMASSSRPDFTGVRHLIVSPFCDPVGLDIVAQSSDAVIVGRQEDLDRLPEESVRGRDVYVVSELAGLPSGDGDPKQGILTGLHAKLYVVEQGWDARLFVGSANATDAAFGGNTELLVELMGRRTSLGVDTMVAMGAGFRGILEPYNRQPPTDRDSDQWRLENFLRDAAATPLTATVQPNDEMYKLAVTSPQHLPPTEGIRLVAELVTRPGEAADMPVGAPVSVWFDKLSIIDITPFLVLTATDLSGRSASTVVRSSLVGDPKGRLDEILARQVDTAEKFLRFLALLLGLGADNALPGGPRAEGTGSWAGVVGPGVLELLLQALADQPDRLDDLAGLVSRLESTERERRLLPEGFADLWKVVDSVRQELRAG